MKKSTSPPAVIPHGFTYINSLHQAPFYQKKSIFNKALSGNDLRLLGDSLSSLHQMAQCYPKCKGGAHILESILGRAYNNACGAILLAQSGLYDECLTLVRGIGECANLIMLVQSVKSEGMKWQGIDPKDEWKEFSPAKVRKKMKIHNVPIPMEEVEYSELCGFVHLNKKSEPNNHSDGKQSGFLGVIYQENGYVSSFAKITEHVTTLAMLGSKATGRDDLFDLIKSTLVKLGRVPE